MSKKLKKRSNPEEAVPPTEIPVSRPSSKKSKTPSVFEEAKSVEDALKGIKKTLQAAGELKGLTLNQVQAWCQSRDICIPWPSDLAPSPDFCKSPAAAELCFDFEAPKSIVLAGSFMLQSYLANEDSNVDMIVEQPDGLVFRFADGAKDHINWRYWLRRTFYLVVCYEALRKALPSSASITFDRLHGNPYKSIIVIKFPGINPSIRIIPSLPFSETFKSKMFRLSPQKSNVRPAWLQSWSEGGSNNFESNVKEAPGPYHNYSLLSEALYLPHLIHLHGVMKSSPVLSASVKMIKAWLKQSGASPVTSFNGFTASMWLVDMVKAGIINPAIMDELQIFRFVLKSWVDAFGPSDRTEFSKNLSGFEGSFEGFETAPALSLLAGPMNLFHAANMNSLQNLSQLASSTLSFLACHPDRLDRIFLTKLGCEMFTHDFVIDYTNVKVESIKGLPSGVIQNYGNVLSSGYLEGRIALVLRKGLTDRFKGPISISVSKSLHEASSFDIKIGLTFDTQNFDRIIDLGPNNEDQEASAKFRGFWGSKSELRQFKDSAIRECVCWESVKNPSTIPREIIAWLFARHFGLSESFISSDTAKKLNFFKSASDAFSKFSGAFDALGRDLRGLNQVLPLTIVQCVGLSPAHRHTSLHIPEARDELTQVFPSSLLPNPSCPIYDFLIRFERSSAWPDERQALQSARQAFLLQLNRTLLSRKMVQGALVANEYIDIYYKGYVFRGWIEVPREELRCRAEGLIAEAERIERRNFWQTRLSNVLHQVATRHGAFSETARLAKTFLSGHLMSLDDDLVDNLVALIFLEKEDQKGSGKASWVGSLLQNRPAGTALTGFLRFLDLLINFPWSERSLVLDFTAFEGQEEQMSQLEVDQMNSSDWSALIRTSSLGTEAISIIPIFTREQKAMILNSLGDSQLSSLIPTLPVDFVERITLIRCKLLAKLTLEHLEATATGEDVTLQGFFKMSPEAIKNDFDILVKLDEAQVQTLPGHHIEGLTKILRNAPQSNPLLFSMLPGFSAPLRLVKELGGPLKSFNASISYNASNPLLMAIRVKDSGKIEEVYETVKKIGGDLIKDIRITNQ